MSKTPHFKDKERIYHGELCPMRIKNLPYRQGDRWISYLERAASASGLYTDRYYTPDGTQILEFHTIFAKFFTLERFHTRIDDRTFYNRLQFTENAFGSEKKIRDTFHKLKNNLEKLIEKDRLDYYRHETGGERK